MPWYYEYFYDYPKRGTKMILSTVALILCYFEKLILLCCEYLILRCHEYTIPW